MLRRDVLVLLSIGILVIGLWPNAEAEARSRRRVFRMGNACRTFSCVRSFQNRRFRTISSSRRSRVNRSARFSNFPSRRVINRGQFIDVNDFDSLDSHIASGGGRLFEKDRITGRVRAQLFINPQTGELTKAFTDENGRIIDNRRFRVPPSSVLSQELMSLYQRTRNGFRAAENKARGTRNFFQASQNLQQVDRFLSRNVPSGPGLVVDMKNSVVPDNGSVPEEEMKIKALRFLINSLNISNNRLADIGGYNDTKSISNINQFLTGGQVALLKQGSPYACGDANAPVPLDYLIAKAMDPEVYAALLGMESNFEDYARQRGIFSKSDELSRERLAGGRVGRIGCVHNDGNKRESIVTSGDFRCIGYEDQRDGQTFYRSYDFDNSKFGFVTDGRNRNPTLANPNTIRFDAQETIGRLPNGYMDFGLWKANGGALINSAPEEIASGVKPDPYGPHGGANGIKNPSSCFYCHSVGFRAFNPPDKNPDTYKFEILDNLNPEFESIGQKYYVRNSQYRTQAQIDSDNWLRKLRGDGREELSAYIPAKKDLVFGTQLDDPYPIIPKMIQEYVNPLSFNKVAQMLGVNDSSSRQELGRALVALGADLNQGIPRRLVELNFCRLKSTLGRGADEAFPVADRDRSGRSHSASDF